LESKQFCYKQEIIELSNKIKSALSFDLVKKEYKGKTPLHGSCYIASEACYHLLSNPDVIIKRYKLDNGVVHWWLELNGEIIDITKDQFDFSVPYYLGKACGFLTKEPSKRCRTLIERVSSNGE
jgi:hypothetical protein